MQNIKQYQQAHSQYQQPTPQYLLIRQSDPIIQCNLSNLSSNYQSILFQNQEEVYYQIQQVYIPRSDNLYKMLGDVKKVELKMQIIPYFGYEGFTGTATNPFPLVKSVIDNDNFYFGYSLEYWQLPITLEIPQTGTLTPQQIVAQIKNQLQHHAYVAINIDKAIADADTDYPPQSRAWYKYPLLAAFFNCLTDFYYDTEATRYAFSFDMKGSKVLTTQVPTEWAYARPTALDASGGFNILGFDIIFDIRDIDGQYAAFKERQKRLVVNMLGSDKDMIEGFTIAYTKMSESNDDSSLVDSSLNQTWAATFSDYSIFSTLCKANSTHISASLLHRAVYQVTAGFTADPFQQPLVAFSLAEPHFYTTDFCFVQSSADTSSWTVDGVRSTTLDIFHRAEQAQVTECTQTSPLVRARLSALKSLSLRLVDADGDTIYPASPFYIKIVIYF